MINVIPFVTKGQTVLIAVDEILYIEHATRKTNIHTESEIYSKYNKLDDIMIYLPSHFYRIHKSLVINMAKVKAMKNQTIFFHNGTEYPLCSVAFRDTRQMYSNYVITKYNKM